MSDNGQAERLDKQAGGESEAIPGRPVTIYQVAAELGVSTATVSRSFSRPGRVNAHTARWVRKRALEMGYRAKDYHYDSSLRHDEQRLLTLVLADIQNPVFTSFIVAFQEQAASLGYVTSLLAVQEDKLLELRSLKHAVQYSAGLVLVSPRVSDDAIGHIAKVKPLVVVNRKVAPFPSITVDTRRGMYKVIEHLTQIGAKNIFYLSGPADSWNNGLRWRYLREAASEAGVLIKQSRPLEPVLSVGKVAFQEWQKAPTEAVVAFNDQIAFGFIEHVKANGIAVPEEIAVVGMDNSLISQVMTPKLTTLAQPNAQMGKIAAKALVARMNNSGNMSAQQMMLPLKLYCRESTRS